MQTHTRTSPGGSVTSADTICRLRAEALFASTLQPSESPPADQIRHAVATTLRRLGIGGCAGQLAGEYGDHPDTAAARMTWALAMIRAVYPAPSLTPASKPRVLAPGPLAFAS
jgi:hypothetical protein